MFIGHTPADLGKKSERFVVESETGVIKSPDQAFRGRVVAANRNSGRPVCFVGNGWSHPVKDVIDGLMPSFIRVSEDYVLENFPENILDAGK